MTSARVVARAVVIELKPTFTLPLDLDLAGPTEGPPLGAEGAITVRGTALRVEPVGDRKYIERFDP